MSRHYSAAFLLLTAGCASQKTPAPTIVRAPTATPIPTPAPTPIIVVAPPLPIQTPDAEREKRRTIVLREIARLQSASAEQDFAEAWANKNTKFVAVRGAGWHIPGVPENRVIALLNKHDATPIEGTTDVIEFPEQEELGQLALKYATRYNQLLLQKLDEQQNAGGN